MKTGVTFGIAAAGFLTLAGGVLSAQAATVVWSQERTPMAGTLALYNFTSGSLQNQASPGTYDLTLNTATIVTGGGKFGDGVNIDPGTTNANFALAGSSTGLFPTGADPSLSIEMWVNFDSIDTTQRYLIDKRFSDNAAYAVQTVQASGVTALRFIVGGNNINAGVPTAGLTSVTLTNVASVLTLDTWYHLLFTWDGAANTAKIYVDGVEKASQISAAQDFVMLNNARAVRIGNRLGSTYGSIDGQLDGIHIYDGVLTPIAAPEPAALGLLLPLSSMLMLRRKSR